MMTNKTAQMKEILNVTLEFLAELAEDIAAGEFWPDTFDGEFSIERNFWLLDRNLSLLFDVADPCINGTVYGIIKYGNIEEKANLSAGLFDTLSNPEIVKIISQNVIRRGGVPTLHACESGLGAVNYEVKLLPY